MSGTMLLFGKPSLLMAFAYLFLFAAGQSTKECDKSKCPGPLVYYEDLKCKPVYEKPGDCCAVRYDCANLNGRSADKCYVNDNEYAVGQPLKKEDTFSACDIDCVCRLGYNNIASFTCAIVDCFHGPTKEGCYLKNSPFSCCSGEEVCPTDPEERYKCEVDGKTYLDGEYFSPKNNPKLSCTCMEGYKGENVKPFCKTPSASICGTELRSAAEIRENCAPVYYSNQSPQTSCSVFFRCQNSNDTVIHKESGGSPKDKDMTCKFGSLSMHIGDELNQATDYSSVCVKCVCEVPPTPTCQRLPDEECDVTNHPPFEY